MSKQTLNDLFDKFFRWRPFYCYTITTAHEYNMLSFQKMEMKFGDEYQIFMCLYPHLN